MEAIKKMTTLEMFEFAEKRPASLFKEATSRNMEITDYLIRAVPHDGVGSPKLDPFKKILQKEKLRLRGGNAAQIGDFILEDKEPSQKRAYRRMLFHETMRREIDQNLNSGLKDIEPVDISSLTGGIDPNAQKITGGFSISENLRDSIMRPTTQRPTRFKERPRLVVELSDIAMGETEIGFGGEKQLIINNEHGRFPTPRIAELEEIPRARMDHESISHTIQKYGIGVEASYELIQNAANMGFDQVQTYFSQLALYWRMHEV